MPVGQSMQWGWSLVVGTAGRLVDRKRRWTSARPGPGFVVDALALVIVDVRGADICFGHRALVLGDFGGEHLAQPDVKGQAGFRDQAIATELLQGVFDLVAIKEPVVGILSQHALDDGVENGRPRADFGEGFGLGFLDGLERQHDVAALEGILQRQQLIQADAEGEEVAAGVEGLGGGLLRRHVGEFALDGAGLGLLIAQVALGDAEVDELHDPVVGDEDVMRVDVAMDDMQGVAVVPMQRVGVGEGLTGLHHHVDDVAHRNMLSALAAAVDHGAPGGAVDVLHRQEDMAMVVADVVDLDDVWRRQHRLEPGFVHEHAAVLVVAPHMPQHALDDEQLTPARPPRQEDFAHAAKGQSADQRIRAKGSLVVGNGALGEGTAASRSFVVLDRQGGQRPGPGAAVGVDPRLATGAGGFAVERAVAGDGAPSGLLAAGELGDDDARGLGRGIDHIVCFGAARALAVVVAVFVIVDRCAIEQGIHRLGATMCGRA